MTEMTQSRERRPALGALLSLLLAAVVPAASGHGETGKASNAPPIVMQAPADGELDWHAQRAIAQGKCYRPPPKPLAPFKPSVTGPHANNVIVMMTFKGSGTSPPDVEVEFTDAAPLVVEAIVKHLRTARVPCRKVDDPPALMQQTFKINPSNEQSRQLPDRSLRSFLKRSIGPGREAPNFDFVAMGCPFELNYEVRGPGLPNIVMDQGPYRAERRPLLLWLSQQDLLFEDEHDRRELFGQKMQIQVDCTPLKPEPPAPRGGTRTT